MKCMLCDKALGSNNALSRHVNKCHNISPEEYILKEKYAGVHPLCKCGCGKKTKFRKGGVFDFMSFLRGHKDQKIKNEIESKRKKTCLEKYGVVCALQSNQAKKKTIETNLKRHGVDHYSKTKECKEKIKKTTLERFGAEWYTQSEDYKKNHLKKLFLSWEDIRKICEKKEYTPCFSYEDYKHNRTYLEFKCNKHNVVFSSNVCNVQRSTGVQCPKCKSQGISSVEQEVAFFVEKKTKIDRNTKKIIPPWEVDIYVPDKKIAIEFNGLYWHSELHKTKNYHLDKFKLCERKDISLLQIYEDEWRDNRDIWESIMCVKLGLTENFSKLNARDLIVDDDPSVKTLRKFLDDNHLQGYANAKKKFALKTKEGEIVFCITLREPFTKNKDCTTEIARVCSKKNCLVRGGFSRLMKRVIEWSKQKEHKTILTYSDCRYSTGEAYKKYGFEFYGHTGIGYDYTDGHDRFFRFKFRAKDGKTEREIAEENGIFKIYNAGNYIWKYLIN